MRITGSKEPDSQSCHAKSVRCLGLVDTEVQPKPRALCTCYDGVKMSEAFVVYI